MSRRLIVIGVILGAALLGGCPSDSSRLSQDAANGASDGTDGTDAACTSTDARVGQTAVLTRHFHNVSGTVRIADDCTVVIESFNYDGGGPNVRVTGSRDGDFRSGIYLSDDISRGTAFVNETLSLRLPSGATLDDVRHISIWCADFDVSFGDAAF